MSDIWCKGSRKVEKAEVGELLMAYCCNEVVMLRQKSSFGRVIFGIGRLIMNVQGVKEKVFV